VAHKASEFAAGSTVTLTLQDASLLETDPDSRRALGLEGASSAAAAPAVLENVDLAGARRHRDGLRAKRQLEMGAGRAGAYAGFDDDEFEELGGTQGPSRLARGQRSGLEAEAKSEKRIGFILGSLAQGEEEEEEESDLFAPRRGKAVSLEPSHGDLVASDFMTIDEDESRRKKKQKGEAKFKSKKKDRRESKKNRRRRADVDDEDDEDDEGRAASLRATSNGGSKTLLEELEETAAADASPGGRKRRRRRDEGEEGEGEGVAAPGPAASSGADEPPASLAASSAAAHGEGSRRAKFDAVMAKGNERTLRAFATRKPQHRVAPGGYDDDEPDDAFLNAALTKARRLNRLKELAGPLSVSLSAGASASSAAEAVAAAVLSSSASRTDAPGVTSSGGQGGGAGGGGTVEFAVDEAGEFARALQARAEQQQREAAKRKSQAAAAAAETPKAGGAAVGGAAAESLPGRGDIEGGGGDDDGDVDMAELAKDVSPDDDEAGASALLEGSTGAAAPLGRGLGGVMGLLRQTGELTRVRAGREELRGRAKDERHYEDYDDVDLSKVVKIDERTATDKDKELARRQVKLEWRDEHGRLLTRKEAFREMSKQFHGYGSGRRKAEKKLAQIAREQAEARQASQASAASVGALQRAQKAAGKAYVVHKT
jgi:U4/U6.U5 tri-snRNP-associated protein 1